LEEVEKLLLFFKRKRKEKRKRVSETYWRLRNQQHQQYLEELTLLVDQQVEENLALVKSIF